MTTPTPRNVRTADVADGPLVGEGRMRRIMPFLVTASICMLVAVPTTSLARPGFTIVGSALALIAMVASVRVPLGSS